MKILVLLFLFCNLEIIQCRFTAPYNVEEKIRKLMTEDIGKKKINPVVFKGYRIVDPD